MMAVECCSNRPDGKKCECLEYKDGLCRYHYFCGLKDACSTALDEGHFLHFHRLCLELLKHDKHILDFLCVDTEKKFLCCLNVFREYGRDHNDIARLITKFLRDTGKKHVADELSRVLWDKDDRILLSEGDGR